jgi:hypothetical protein
MSWLDKLATDIEKAKTGDVIVVKSEAAKELAERARLRMCPEKKIVFRARIEKEAE